MREPSHFPTHFCSTAAWSPCAPTPRVRCRMPCNETLLIWQFRCSAARQRRLGLPKQFRLENSRKTAATELKGRIAGNEAQGDGGDHARDLLPRQERRRWWLEPATRNFRSMRMPPRCLPRASISTFTPRAPRPGVGIGPAATPRIGHRHHSGTCPLCHNQSSRLPNRLPRPEAGCR